MDHSFSTARANSCDSTSGHRFTRVLEDEGSTMLRLAGRGTRMPCIWLINYRHGSNARENSGEENNREACIFASLRFLIAPPYYGPHPPALTPHSETSTHWAKITSLSSSSSSSTNPPFTYGGVSAMNNVSRNSPDRRSKPASRPLTLREATLSSILTSDARMAFANGSRPIDMKHRPHHAAATPDIGGF